MPKILLDQDEKPSLMTINQVYANNYNNWREKEEHTKLKARYGDINIEDDDSDNPDGLSDSSSATESELENEDFKSTLENELSHTLKLLQSKDPKIYDKNFQCFKDSKKYKIENNDNQIDGGTCNKKGRKNRQMTLKDYERHIILNKKGVFSDDDTFDNKRNIDDKLSYVQQQDKIKQNFNKILGSTQDNENSDEDLFSIKKKAKISTTDPVKMDGSDESDLDTSSLPLKRIFETYNHQTGETELTSDKYDDSNSRIPVNMESESEEESDQFLYSQNLQEVQDKVMSPKIKQPCKYRFEEMSQEGKTLRSYPRILPAQVSDQLMRLKTGDKREKRKTKRLAKLEKKRVEKLKAMEDVKRLRGLQLKEIRKKLDKLEKVAGIKGLDSVLTLEDIDKDYDPKKFDRMIAKMFDDQYYEKNVDPTKPVFDDTDEELEQIKKFKDLKRNLDDYSKLQFEGIVAGIPTRFKYRQVVPNQFGLTLDEIFCANDKELNKWVSLKKMFQYRTDQEEKFDLHAYKVKGQQLYKKRKILNSLFEMDENKIESEPNDLETVPDLLEKQGAITIKSQIATTKPKNITKSTEKRDEIKSILIPSKISDEKLSSFNNNNNKLKANQRTNPK
ncbi:unnamed protein product [Gordionus sp. m RMFG-2023]